MVYTMAAGALTLATFRGFGRGLGLGDLGCAVMSVLGRDRGQKGLTGWCFGHRGR